MLGISLVFLGLFVGVGADSPDMWARRYTVHVKDQGNAVRGAKNLSKSASAGKSRRGVRWFFLWSFLGFLVLGGVLYAVDIIMTEGRVPRGVAVGGVDIGGMTYSQAEQRLRIDLGDSARSPVTIHAGELQTVIEPTQSGLGVDWAATVEQAGQQPLNPITRVRSFFDSREVGMVTSASGENLNRAVDRASRDLTREPKDAGLSIGSDGRANVEASVDGQTVDPEVLRDTVEGHWLNKEHSLTLEADIVEPAISTDAAERTAREVIDPATSAPLEFRGRDNVKALISPVDMGQIISFTPEGNGFVVNWNSDAARKILEPQLSSTTREQRDANFRVVGRSVEVIPHQDGVAINWGKTLDGLQSKFLSETERRYDVAYEDKKATYTTEQANKAHFDDTVGEFTTSGFSDASGVNIRRVAQMVDGAVVLPGETFSLNGFTGPRGEAQGFVESGIIRNGRADKAVGGGISQFATTLYNASYFAGMEDVSHTPHSYYISRYPAGREATVFEGAIDLQFKNPFDTPVLIRSSAGSSEVTVSFYGVKEVEVESIAGPRTNPTSPQRQTITGEDCEPSSGIPGFTITDTRVIRGLDGEERSRETQTTVYDPQPIVTCKR